MSLTASSVPHILTCGHCPFSPCSFRSPSYVMFSHHKSKHTSSPSTSAPLFTFPQPRVSATVCLLFMALPTSRAPSTFCHLLVTPLLPTVFSQHPLLHTLYIEVASLTEHRAHQHRPNINMFITCQSAYSYP